ncbi:MAG: type II secretion system protein M [Gammaproteobacteria bacterium]|nr:type II secretion system protein M [Gammaproteobacteria bacterium]MBU2407593.1 type II secretion system protein M [Gammaproteobacteria bacterium]
MNWISTLEARWEAWWPELAPREQRLIAGGAALILLAFLWWVTLAPALRTLSAAKVERVRLDAQLQQMTTLQNRAKALQSQPRANRDDSLRALETSVRQNLGQNAQIRSTSGNEGVTIALRTTPADTLAQWFSQARSNARAVPREVHLTRTPASAPQPNFPAAPAGAPGNDASGVRWDGTLVMGLPPR